MGKDREIEAGRPVVVTALGTGRQGTVGEVLYSSPVRHMCLVQFADGQMLAAWGAVEQIGSAYPTRTGAYCRAAQVFTPADIQAWEVRRGDDPVRSGVDAPIITQGLVH